MTGAGGELRHVELFDIFVGMTLVDLENSQSCLEPTIFQLYDTFYLFSISDSIAFPLQNCDT